MGGLNCINNHWRKICIFLLRIIFLTSRTEYLWTAKELVPFLWKTTTALLAQRILAQREHISSFIPTDENCNTYGCDQTDHGSLFWEYSEKMQSQKEQSGK